MKTILTTIIGLALGSSAFAGQQINAAAWRNVQTYDVGTLFKKAASLNGQIVAVHFHYRSEKLRHLHPTLYEASIWQHDPKAKNGYSTVRVMVPKQDVPAFQTIPFDFNSMTEQTIYGRLEKDPDNNVTYLRLLGRKVTTDAAGNATVDW
jgi:hypothetical protein